MSLTLTSLWPGVFVARQPPRNRLCASSPPTPDGLFWISKAPAAAMDEQFVQRLEARAYYAVARALAAANKLNFVRAALLWPPASPALCQHALCMAAALSSEPAHAFSWATPGFAPCSSLHTISISQDTEALLMDLQLALNLTDEVAMVRNASRRNRAASALHVFVRPFQPHCCTRVCACTHAPHCRTLCHRLRVTRRLHRSSECRACVHGCMRIMLFCRCA